MLYEVITDLFDRFGKDTPTIAKVNPAGKNDMEAFWKAGGIPSYNFV